MAWKPRQSPDEPLWPDGPESGPIAPDPAPNPPGPSRNCPGPSEEDRAWAAEASERGAFLPEIKTPGAGRKRKNIWGDRRPEK
jgi:hypothetical protein